MERDNDSKPRIQIATVHNIEVESIANLIESGLNGASYWAKVRGVIKPREWKTKKCTA